MTERTFNPICCCFCGKHRKEVRSLIVGPSVTICDECVGLCQDILEEEQQARRRRERVPVATIPIAELREIERESEAARARVESGDPDVMPLLLELCSHRIPQLLREVWSLREALEERGPARR